ncbi:MAG: endonuclease [bacterium (Candidatus Stahlbacteria) CG08_land_8_20_14_0_20_40_26]|nr:MAG: endonuclease [bacterium (Candidatus Stahlbacteria) CG23_combo_of_CG06-09_8_20_14_all_40_9]PIS24727.1 MAG: endonuclease [bacterium (Candidatus Stahlbacteria) CG08_land_8_20_14_0_20_40_26]
MSYYLYALVNDNGRIYVGISCNPQKRLREHNSGKTKSTKGYRPWSIFFVEQYNSRRQAREREKYWKSGTGKERLKRLLSLFSSSVGYLPAGRQGAPVS